jgi:UDP-2,3-diacylglucosamine pyrophosphatase LpxH
MATIKRFLLHLLASTLLLVGQSCSLLPDFDPLNFVRTNYDVDKRFADSQQLNTLSPIPSINLTNETYLFSAASDIHITDESEQLASYFSFVEQENPSFLLIVGDISNGLTQHVTSAKNQFDGWNKIPCYYVAGNHDIYFSWHEYVQRFGSSTYTFEVQTPNAIDLYIGIESGSATLGKKQKDWLIAQLANRHLYRHCIIFTHTNFFARQFDTNGIYTKEERMVLLSLFAQYEVTMVISGHAHKESRKTVGNVEYITMPALVDRGSMLFEVSNNIQVTTIDL